MKKKSFTKKFLALSATIVLLASIAVGVDQIQRQQATNAQAATCTHYVAINGNDSNSGTSTSSAWKTIQKGVNSISAGDILCVRGGTYYENITISKSGTSSNPLIIRSYPGESPVLDGRAGVSCINCGLPSGSIAKTDPKSGKGHNWGGLVKITGSNIIFDGFESKRSMGRGIAVANSSSGVRNVTIKNCRVQYARSAAINIQHANGLTVEGCRIWRNADFATYSRGASTLNWPVIVAALWSDNVTFRNNVIFNNWGEGVVAGRGSSNVLVEGNIVYDNYAMQAYSNRSQNATFRNNLMYFSNDPEFYRGGHPSSCIVLNNEQQNYHAAKNVTIINNLLMGCQQNIGMWAQGSPGTKEGTPNILIAHNTLINSNQEAIFITSADSPPYSGQIKNNLIIEQSGTVTRISSGQNIVFSNNLWWPNGPGSNAAGSGDVYSDPKLSMSGSTSAGQLSPNYFRIISSNSAAINKAISVPGASKDYFGSSRDSQPDIGAHEYGGSAPLPTPYPTQYPTPTSSTCPPVTCESWTDTYVDNCTPFSKYESAHPDCTISSRSVTIRNNVSEASEVRYKNANISTLCADTSFSNSYQSRTSTKSWTLTSGDGEKKVCAQFMNSCGNTAKCGGMIRLVSSTTPQPSPSPTSIPTTQPTSVPTSGPSATSVPPGPSGNILSNPSFEYGTGSWKMHNVGGNISYSVVTPGTHGSSSAKLSVVNPGTQLQFYQSGLTLDPDTEYRLSFDAYSSTGHDLSVYVHEHDDDFTNYGLANHTADLATGWNTFQTTFTTIDFTQNASDARLRFWFGPFDEPGDVYHIDNVILTKTQEPSSKQGDANGDGKVDGIDYVIWLRNFGKTNPNGAQDGDFNGDNKVDGIDYVIWVRNVSI